MTSKTDMVMMFLGRVFLWVLFLFALLYFTGERGNSQSFANVEVIPVRDEEKARSAFDIAKKRNVLILFRTPEGQGYGSGVIVETGLVLTAKHMGERPYTEFQINGKPAKVVAQSATYDVMLLSASTAKFGKAKLQEKTYLGEPVFYVGNPEEHNGLLSRGHVVFLGDGGIHTDTLGAMGFSGSGLWNEKGELIGIQVTMEGFDVVGFKLSIAVPIAEAKKLLKGVK